MGKAKVVRVEIFDPPMCCPTGLCGPTIDPQLMAINEAVIALREKAEVQRYIMTTHPQAFLKNPEVHKLIREHGLAVLPITMVNGKILRTRAYPSFTELLKEVENDA